MTRIGTLFTIILAGLLGAPTTYSAAPPSPAYVIHDLHVAPDGALVVAHTKGVFRSTDGGQNWEQVLNTDNYWGQLLGAPHFGLLLNNGVSLFYSGDFGVHWILVKKTTLVGDIHKTQAIDKYGRLYGCAGDRVEFSDDYGNAWNSLEPFPTLTKAAQHCISVIAAGEVLYAVSDGSDQRLFKSTDRGKRWLPIDALQPANSHLSDLFFDSNGTLYSNQLIVQNTAQGDHDFEVRIYRSKDLGNSWQRLVFDPPGNAPLGCGPFVYYKVIAVDRNSVYLTCGNKLYVATDGVTNTSLGSNFQGQIAFGPHRLFSYNNYGIQALDPFTNEWKPLGRKGLPNTLTGIPESK